MKKSNFVLLILIAALLFIFGCSGIGQRNGGSNINLDYKAIHTGTEGIVLQFLPNLPPDKAYEGNYNLGFKLSNKGAYDVDEKFGFLVIKTDPAYIKIEPLEQKFSLKGKSLLNPKGEETINADSTMDIKRLPKDTKKKGALIFVDLCYKYQTEAVADVCIDTDVYNLNFREKACKAKDISLSSQGAPIAVTRIRQNMKPVGGKREKLTPEFEITIANVGNGVPYEADLSEAICKQMVEPEKWTDVWNSVHVKAEIPGSGLKFECTPDTLRLDREQSVKCYSLYDSIDANTPPYSTALKVNVEYGYTTSLSRRVEIVKMG